MFGNIKAAILSALLSLATLPAMAQDHRNVDELSRIETIEWENGSAVAVSGERAYVLEEGVGVHIVDISYPRAPRPIADFAYDGSEWGIDASGDLVCIAAGNDGIILIDVSDPMNPEQIGSFQDVGNARGVVFGDGFLCVASGSDGVFILSIEDPTRPEIWGMAGLQDFALNMDLAGDLLFVTDRSQGLKIIDISDLENPEIIGTVEARGETRDVAVLGDNAFLAENGVLSQIDVSNPASPERIAEINVSYIYAVAASEQVVYAARRDYGWLSVHDANNQLREMGHISYNRGPRDVAVIESGLALTTSPGVGLKIIDASNMAQPFEHGRCGTSINFQSLYSLRDRLYVGASDIGTMLFDIADPGEPLLIWQDTPPYDISTCQIVGNDTLLFAGMTGYDDPTRAADISNPDTLIWLFHENLRGSTYRLALWQNRLYKLAENGSVYIYDVSDPTRVREIGQFWAENQYRPFQDIAVIGDMAYIAAGTARGDSIGWTGLLIMDVADHQQARLQGSIRLASDALCVTIRGSTAFVGLRNGLATVNIRNQREPSLISRIDLPDDANEVVLEGDFAIVACNEGGLRVISIANPENMVETGFFDTPGEALGVAVFGDAVAVADGNGLGFYDCSVAFERNQAPVWIDAPEAFVLEIGDTLEFGLTAEDPDGDELTISLDPGGIGEGFEFNDNSDGTCEFLWVTGDDDAGEYQPVFTVTDGRSRTQLPITIIVNSDNRAPIWMEDTTAFEVEVNTLIWFDVVAQDPDSNNITISLDPVNLPQGYQFRDNGNGSADFVWQPQSADTGLFKPLFIATDGEDSDSLEVFIRVISPNEALNREMIPLTFSVKAFPNPFNSSTTITYSLPRPGRYALSVVDIAGREVVRLEEGWREAGSYREVWNGGTLSSGQYVIRLKGDAESLSNPITIIK